MLVLLDPCLKLREFPNGQKADAEASLEKVLQSDFDLDEQFTNGDCEKETVVGKKNPSVRAEIMQELTSQSRPDDGIENYLQT